jgi:hypothetical protein
MTTEGYTVDDIMAEGPCPNYPRARVVELWDGRERLTPHEIAELDIPLSDRIWALSHLLYRLSPYRVKKVTRMIALDVADLWPCPDIVWHYLVTGDSEYEAAASAAFQAATLTAAEDAARVAAWDAAGDTWDAAWVAWVAWNAALAARDAWSLRDAGDDANAALERYLGWLVRAWEVRT